MMRKVVLLLVVLGATSNVVLANPTMNAQLRALQLSETYHVQVTLARIQNPPGIAGMDMQWSMFEPVAIRRDGVELHMQEPALIEANSGSGISSGPGWQACDCNLPPGHYTYEFVPPEDKGVADWAKFVDVKVTEPPPARERRSRVEEVRHQADPWDEEETWPQGVDCLAWCAEHPETAGSAVDVGVDSGTTELVPEIAPEVVEPVRTSGSGCGAGGTSGSASSWALLLLPVLWLRRQGASRPGLTNC